MPTTAEEERKQQFAALKRYMEQEAARLNREMPGATEKQKSEALVARMTDSMEKARKKNQLESLTAVLSGKILKRAQNQSDRDYSGGGFYSEQSESISLYADATFRYEKRSFSSVSGGGLSFPCERKLAETGTWSVQMIGGDARLVLRKGAAIFRSWKTRDGGTGVQYLDGVLWSRYRM